MISSQGEIWSWKTIRSTKIKRWKHLKGWKSVDGYWQIGLTYPKTDKRYTGPGSRKIFYLHRLVLEVFIGPCPKNMEACHNDSNQDNNILENLRWDTPKNNCKDRNSLGIWEKNLPKGEEHHNSKFSNKQVLKIRKLYKQGLSTIELSNMFGCNKSTINSIVKKETWTHLI